MDGRYGKGGTGLPTQYTGMGTGVSQAISKEIFFGLSFSVLLFVGFIWYLYRGSKEPIRPGEKWVLIFGGFGLVIFFVDAFLQLVKGVLI